MIAWFDLGREHHRPFIYIYPGVCVVRNVNVDATATAAVAVLHTGSTWTLGTGRLLYV